MSVPSLSPLQRGKLIVDGLGQGGEMRERQTDRQADTERHIQTDRQADRQADRKTETQTDR